MIGQKGVVGEGFRLWIYWKIIVFPVFKNILNNTVNSWELNVLVSEKGHFHHKEGSAWLWEAHIP